MNMKADDRAKLVSKGMRLAYDSLQSHLPWTYLKSAEGKAWHKKCVKDYVEMMMIYRELL